MGQGSKQKDTDSWETHNLAERMTEIFDDAWVAVQLSRGHRAGSPTHWHLCHRQRIRRLRGQLDTLNGTGSRDASDDRRATCRARLDDAKCGRRVQHAASLTRAAGPNGPCQKTPADSQTATRVPCKSTAWDPISTCCGRTSCTRTVPNGTLNLRHSCIGVARGKSYTRATSDTGPVELDQ